MFYYVGHYEGIDQRVIDEIVDEEISIGDYVLTGGEIPAMVVIDTVSRYVGGVISKKSLEEESFSGDGNTFWQGGRYETGTVPGMGKACCGSEI